MTVAFTWNGLKALGVDETSLATFPEEFKQGMPARADILGDTGANRPDNWVGDLRARIFTPLPFYLPAMSASGSVAIRNTKDSLRTAKASRCSPP